MVLPQDSSKYLSLYDSSPPRSRQSSAGLGASIWAPQPQPSETAWPRALDSFSRAAERDMADIHGLTNHQKLTSLPLISREDVFGSLNTMAYSTKDIGAIGDGRKKNTPEYQDTHVEQLLRTLNLNSPAPFAKKPQLNLDVGHNSPDFSPASVSSALLTPTDLSPARAQFDPKNPGHSPYDAAHSLSLMTSSLLFEQQTTPAKLGDSLEASAGNLRYQPSSSGIQPFQPFSEPPTPAPHTHTLHSLFTNTSPSHSQSIYSSPLPRRVESARLPQMDWRLTQQPLSQQPLALHTDWRLPNEKATLDFNLNQLSHSEPMRSTLMHQQPSPSQQTQTSHEPINFLSLLHPSSSPPYHIFVSRIIKSSDQQASIFLQQKLKVADVEERSKIVDAICARGFEMMAHRFGNWAVQRCLEAASTAEERRKIVSCMRGRIVDLATNCYGCHVLQKALDCEEDIRLLIVSELLLGDPAQTLVNKHASHVWSKIMELSWTPPAPPIFAFVNKSLKGKWASLACHETGSLVVQHAFENLEPEAKDGIVDELLNQGAAIFSEVAKNQWGSYCIQHILEHGSEKHRRMTLDHLLDGLLEFATNEQGSKSVTKALKEGGKETLDRVVKRMCEPAKGARRAMIVDLALSVTGSQLIASVLPTADKDQRALLYECIRGHIVTLRGCKTGSKVIWLFDRMRAYYGY
ncbi:ARM repeat-containing protein [Macrolepiota fuliginosa MF-IS2]|uniref:ARM repeat-containing protein n=1 Tax=Macrolepiota fuliginosa MF-IS2 TaxID=1400762 RepID=A0A9P6C3L6_9AGAR|nr:ARM repeat-containing protein [Macrolepiota fuliginosa MF-IS2]